MRFRGGKAQAIGGFESLTQALLTGVCRSVFAWTDNSAVLNIAFGTNKALQVWQGGLLSDITPFGPPAPLGADPLTVSNASAVITVHHVAHGYPNGTSLKVFGSTPVGRIVPDGTFPITVIDVDHYSYTFTSNATVAKLLGTNPLSVINTDPTVTVSEPAHGIANGTTVTITGATAIGGITPNGAFPISVIDADHYSYEFTSAATSTVTAGGGTGISATVPKTGGDSKIQVTPQTALSAGPVDGTGSAGYGTGAYGIGPWGETSPTADYFPRTWAEAAWGQKLAASPRGGGLYLWSNDVTQRAVAVNNAPTRISHMIVTPQFQIMAIGCTQENGTYNPKCIRHSAVRDETTWASDATSASTAREYPLPGGGRLVAGAVIGKNILAWSDHELWLGTYVGQVGQVWRFDKVGDGCGLIGPNAAVVVGVNAFWISPDRQFHSYTLGGGVTAVPCPIREDFATHLAASQGDKIVASSIAEFSEIRFEYPDDREGYENSRYIALCVEGPDAGSWYKGEMARTAMVDAGPNTYPVGTTFAGEVYWHEKGHSADGGPFAWFIESADIYLDENSVYLVRSAWPDIAEQVGAVSLTVSSRTYPQGDVTVVGPMVLAPGQDRVDFMAKGRLFRLRLEANTAPTQARFGRLTFDAKQGGRK